MSVDDIMSDNEPHRFHDYIFTALQDIKEAQHRAVEVQLKHAETNGRIEAMLDNLAGPQGRVTKLEDDLSWAEKKSWIKSAVVIPVTLALNFMGHKIAGR